MTPFKRLQNAVLNVEISPEMGGSIVNVTHKGFSVMRPWNAEKTVRKTASYPLVPFSNRIAEGQFSFEGKSYQLAKNFGDHPHTIHGIGWERAWDYEAISDTECLLSLSYVPQAEYDWPFAFTVTQRITLNGDSLRVEMRFTNQANGNAPVGLGWHPFFPRHDGVKLSMTTEKVWLNDDRMLPTDHVIVPEHWDFSKGKIVDYVGSDNCYSGWHGKAVIDWIHHQKQITLTASPNVQHLVFFTPPAPADFIAVEPVTNANNAINKADPSAHGMSVLAQGESFMIFMELTVTENAS